jgi:ADP-ribose pyrophosphatase YjhB (NUDIX family)
MQLRSKYYRVSAKALVLDETKAKFLLMRQDNGVWDMPGGGLDWGEKPHECLTREIDEEMGLKVRKIATQPSYFLGGYQVSPESDLWVVNVVYEAELESLDFVPSDECQEIRFVSALELVDMENIPPTVQELAEQFNSQKHKQ